MSIFYFDNNSSATNVTIGGATQIPFVNGAADDFSYSSNLVFNGTKLVIGNATAAASLHVKSYSILAANTAFLVQNSVSTDLFKISDSGNVGLGNRVNAVLQNQYFTRDSSIIFNETDLGGSGRFLTINSGDEDGGLMFRTTTSNTMNVYSIVMTLKRGNVGIGTISPTAKLQVVGLATYTNNADAITAGLTAGAIYIRNGHGLDIVI